MAGGYDDGYRHCSCFWGTTPGRLVVQLEHILGSFDGLTVLDAGCGDGKNAAYCARRGANVTAFDLSEYAIANARRTWHEVSNVSFHVGDVLTDESLAHEYDVVIAYGLIHCLESEDQIRRVVERLKAITRLKGWNVVCSFNNRFQQLEAHPGFEPTLMSHSQICELYHTWSLAHCSDSDLTEVHPHNGIVHTHSMTRILARKP